MLEMTAGSRDPRVDWLRLAGISWIGETVKAGLIKEFASPQAVFQADRGKLAKIKGWNISRLDRFLAEAKNSLPICDPEILDKKGISLVTFNDPDYPQLLRQIPDSPIVLFVMGKLARDDRPHLAIVGARNGTQLGFDIAKDFAYELAKAGFVIVSGLALGIDTFAHKGALEAHGNTIGVLGCGVDIVYPTGNRKIRQEILSTGALISEFSPGTPAKPWHFPIRNRLISGMCVGTLVVEATARSGSLITARLSAEQDRDVFAVPGSIRSDLSQGTLALLKDGAQLAASPKEIIDYYSHLIPQNTAASIDDTPDLNEEESCLVKALANAPVSLDELLIDGRWDRSHLFSLLLTLEMRDILIKFPGNYYQSKIKPPLGR